MKFITDLFTERDGTSWCLVRIAALAPLGSMTWKFLHSGAPYDYNGYAIGAAAVLAAIGFKNISEK